MAFEFWINNISDDTTEDGFKNAVKPYGLKVVQFGTSKKKAGTKSAKLSAKNEDHGRAVADALNDHELDGSTWSVDEKFRSSGQGNDEDGDGDEKTKAKTEGKSKKGGKEEKTDSPVPESLVDLLKIPMVAAIIAKAPGLAKKAKDLLEDHEYPIGVPDDLATPADTSGWHVKRYTDDIRDGDGFHTITVMARLNGEPGVIRFHLTAEASKPLEVKHNGQIKQLTPDLDFSTNPQSGACTIQLRMADDCGEATIGFASETEGAYLRPQPITNFKYEMPNFGLPSPAGPEV